MNIWVWIWFLGNLRGVLCQYPGTDLIRPRKTTMSFDSETRAERSEEQPVPEGRVPQPINLT